MPGAVAPFAPPLWTPLLPPCPTTVPSTLDVNVYRFQTVLIVTKHGFFLTVRFRLFLHPTFGTASSVMV